ncbi:SRPBCC family protein [Xanthobacter autotrophicus DSM 431]|uniref:SRPBCC family protein n=1 Tax=Xanthobacter nonsaccharivorans TaxID=3119912 RepID=UPI00372888DB
MATIQKEILTGAPADEVWDAIRDIGALHTRLVPGFVIDTRLEPGERVVTFFNGATARERIVTLDEEKRRLVWAAEAPFLRHYNGSAQVSERGPLTCVLWTADFLPDDAATVVGPLMEAGAEAMKTALDKLMRRA